MGPSRRFRLTKPLMQEAGGSLVAEETPAKSYLEPLALCLPERLDPLPYQSLAVRPGQHPSQQSAYGRKAA